MWHVGTGVGADALQVEMMKFRAYVRVEGSDFDAEAFNHSLPAELRGEVKCRRFVKERVGGPAREFWESRGVESVDRPEDALHEHLKHLEEVLAASKAGCALKISAQIVFYYCDEDDRRGFYFPNELIALLSRLEADLDVDVAHDLEKLDSPRVS